MLDENNKTAVNRYHDLVFILHRLESQAGDYLAHLNKENTPSNLKLQSKPFKPSVPVKPLSDARSPLVDLSELWDNSIFTPNFDFLKPSIWLIKMKAWIKIFV